jgi:RNA 2',3'-cyclic 3'-phosphodiesterase
VNDRPERLRLFVAVDVPPDVLERLDATIEPQRSAVPNARWAPIANQHITLKFLGRVDVESFPEVRSACERVAATESSAEIRLTGMGAFPNPRRARVIWAGIEDEAQILARVASGLDEALAPLGFAPEKRAFTPHLTLARLKSPADARAFLESVSFASDPWPVTELHLYRSHLSPKGARYEVLETHVLGDAAHG